VARPFPGSEPHVRVEQTHAGKFLYVDGSCASVWPSRRATTNGSWDLLAAPVLLAPTGRAPRVLLLGVGGGTVIRVIRALRPEAAVIAVDLDAEVLTVARREFALDSLGATIVCAEASAYLRRLPAHPGFDVIIDDIYERSTGDMRKPAGWADTLRLARARLRRGGVLVCNALDTADARLVAAWLSPSALALRHADYHNYILVFGDNLSARAVGRTLRSSRLLRPTMAHTSIRTFRAIS
jgi:predicted membrane-bound spermidine synthase